MNADGQMEHFYDDVPGYFWFKQAYKVMLNAMSPTEPSTFVEIGSFHGKSLAFLGVEAINRKIPVTIHSVESFQGWPGVPQGDELREAFNSYTKPLRERLNGRFKLWDMPSMDAAPQFADESCDVVWIDGEHSYESCLADIRAWWPKVKPGGWMGGVDWFMEGVQRTTCSDTVWRAIRSRVTGRGGSCERIPPANSRRPRESYDRGPVLPAHHRGNHREPDPRDVLPVAQSALGLCGGRTH
jgi:hypothetical protein